MVPRPGFWRCSPDLPDPLPVRNPVIVALDVPGEERALELIDALGDLAGGVKVGLQLFCAAGPALVRRIRRDGIPVFLDLKFHDIPHTVGRAMAEAVALDVQMVTVHTLGGVEMMRAAREAALEGAGGGKPPLVLGVTVLTGLDGRDLEEVGIPRSPAEETLRLVRAGLRAGLDGFVCSAREVEMLRATVPSGIRLVTPGIRPRGAAPDDQKRTMEPEAALERGADWLVVGRPVVTAPDPRAVLAGLLETTGDASGPPPSRSRGRAGRAG